MKNERKFPKITVSKKAEYSLKNGHPWIYDTEIISGAPSSNGELCDVFSVKDSYLGTGFWSDKSKIRIRLLSSNANEKFERAFFERRISYAVDFRKAVMGEDFSSCRIVFGEADGLPGLTVDRFSDILVVQVLSFGMDKIKNMIFDILFEKFDSIGEKISGIYEREDVAIRELEGLRQFKGWYEKEGRTHPDSTNTVITENGIKYHVDFENGQKTGFFLDQKYNRLAVSKLAKGKHVLDCFTHTGSFAMNAVMGGAASVLAVDVSSSAVEMARANARLNGIEEKMDFLCADVFDLLPSLEKEKKNDYDFIILDPPAFTKNRKTAASAYRGYKEINYRAMKLLPRGGFLATCSCSHFMPSGDFIKMLKEASRDASVELKQIEARTQGPDHPILLNVPETDYLKFYLFQVV